MLFVFGDYALDLERRELRRGSDLIAIEPQVFDLLVYLLRNRDRVVSKDDLLAAVWGGRIVSESTLTSRINAARRAVGDSGEQQTLIRTIARKGVRFVGSVREASAPAPTPNDASPAVGSLRQDIHFCTTKDGVRIAYAKSGVDYRWSRPPTGSTTSNTTGTVRSGSTCSTRSPRTTG